jgi:hypothetical protein
MKEKIYALVAEKHRMQIPALEDIKNYLKLHWYIVALKQKNLQSFLSMLDTSIFSISAWKLLLNAVSSRKSQMNNERISKLLLIEA